VRSQKILDVAVADKSGYGQTDAELLDAGHDARPMRAREVPHIAQERKIEAQPSRRIAARCSSESDSILMPMFSGPCQASGKNANARKDDPCLRAGDCLLEIFREASAAVEPSKRSLNDPTSRLGLESADTLRSCDDLNDPLAELGDRVGQLLPPVDTVGENVTQLWKHQPDMFQQRHRAMNVLDIGRVDLHGKQRAVRIGDDVTLASLHLLARIKPAWTAAFCRFHTLTVDDSGGRRALASCRTARALDQDTIDLAPDVAVTPIVKVVLNGRERREVFRQRAPLAAGRKNVENRIQDGAKTPCRWATRASALRQQWPQQNPLLSGRVACVAESNAAILPAGDFGPSHVAFPW